MFAAIRSALASTDYHPVAGGQPPPYEVKTTPFDFLCGDQSLERSFVVQLVDDCIVAGNSTKLRRSAAVYTDLPSSDADAAMELYILNWLYGQRPVHAGTPIR